MTNKEICIKYLEDFLEEIKKQHNTISSQEMFISTVITMIKYLK